MYSSYALPFYDIVLLGFFVWNLSIFFFGWESDKNSHKDRSMAGGVQWRKSSGALAVRRYDGIGGLHLCKMRRRMFKNEFL